MGPDLQSVRSIAILRAKGLGDYLLSEPAMDALRRATPRARITLLGAAWQREALIGRPSPVDEILAVPDLPGLGDGAHDVAADVSTTSFFAQMKERQFDIAIQLHGGGRNSNPVVSGLGARYTVGMRAFDAPALDATVPYAYWQPELFRCLEVVRLLGAEPTRVRPSLPVIAADLDAVKTALGSAGLRTFTPIVVIHPGATDRRRRWSPERFAAVARGLLAAGLQVVVIGAGDEANLVQAVTDMAPGAVPMLDLSFSAMVGLLWLAKLLVGNDSGPRHLADAVGTATVSVYWVGNVITAGPRERAYHRVHISWTTECPVCGASCVGEPFPEGCEHQVSLVDDVRTDLVLRSARELLGLDPPV